MRSIEELEQDKKPKAFMIKKKYDPQGLFYGHHAVGSELWDIGRGGVGGRSEE